MAFKVTQQDMEGGDEFELIPAGTVAEVVILSAEERETKKGGTLVHFKLGIVGGDYDERKLFGNINTLCPSSEKATQIGRGELARVCAAAGLTEGYDDVAELVGRSFEAKITVEEAQNGYPAKNGFRVAFKKDPAAPKVGNATAEQLESAKKAVEGSKMRASKGAVKRAAESTKNPWDEDESAININDIPF